MFHGKRKNLHGGNLNMAELELDKLILHLEQSNKAEGKSTLSQNFYQYNLTSRIIYRFGVIISIRMR